MIYGIGCDIVKIPRIATAYRRFGEAFLERLLSGAELKCLPSKREGVYFVAYLAKRYAAKEALAKAIGCGIGGKLSFQQIEIFRNAQGQPYFSPATLAHLAVLLQQSRPSQPQQLPVLPPDLNSQPLLELRPPRLGAPKLSSLYNRLAYSSSSLQPLYNPTATPTTMMQQRGSKLPSIPVFISQLLQSLLPALRPASRLQVGDDLAPEARPLVPSYLHDPCFQADQSLRAHLSLSDDYPYALAYVVVEQ